MATRPTSTRVAGGSGLKAPPEVRPLPAPSAMERDRAALAAALDPVITIDATGIIQSASDSVFRVLGWMPAELIGRNVSILMPEPHHSAHDGYLANYHRTGQTNILNRPRRFDAMRKDGSLLPIELCVSRAETPGAPLFVGMIRDMSAFVAAERSRDEERVRSQQLLAEQTSALQTAHLRLRMADRMASIGTLAAGLGHDMNNVLLPVRARLNALRAAGEAGNLRAAERGHVEEIRKSVAYLQQLADGLHFLALDPDADDSVRGGGGSTDLSQWWSQAGTLLSKAVPKHVRVTVKFPRTLPGVAIAAHGLTQAVLNLVVNAGEAIPAERLRQGHVRLWAESVVKEGREWVRIGVTDNGTGMAEDVRRRAFEMFFTTKTRGLGTGLGLALVRKVVERVGGTVEIESEVGKGTTVIMVVPTDLAADGRAGRLCTAVVSVRDGRAAALIKHVLEVSGVPSRSDGKVSLAGVWVVDPVEANLREAEGWRAKHANGKLVTFGRPGDPRWMALRPIIIEEPEDFDSIRDAIGKAIAPG